MVQRCGSYGFLGAFAAIASGVSYFLLQNKQKECVTNWGDLNAFHIAIVITGICLTVGSLFDVKSLLNKSSGIVSFVTGVLIAGVGCLAAYCAYLEFFKPCKPTAGILPFDIGSTIGATKNIFDANDEFMIAIFILDIVAALLLVSGGFTFFG